MRIDPEHLAHVLHRQIDSSADLTVLAAGLAASPGAAFGSVVFDANEAEHLGRIGSKVILVRVETTPDDIHGIVQAQGILTSRGGMTSHAAVVTRGMGKPCVCGCEAVKVDYEQQLFTVGSTVVRKGELISIDGTTGQVILGAVPLKDPELSKEYQTILEWADEVRTLQVRANADTPEDAEKSRKFGAQGIGLTRTEHMFMAQERLPYVQRMILATTTEERMGALLPLRIMQENDFYSILKAMHDLPVCIRLLDPPLHEFLPSLEKLLVETTELRIRKDNPQLLEEEERLLLIESSCTRPTYDGASRLPPWDHLSRSLRGCSAASAASATRGQAHRVAGNRDSADHQQGGDGDPEGAVRPDRQGVHGAAPRFLHLPVREHDRTAARGPGKSRSRRSSSALDQRPHADMFQVQP